MFYATTIQLLFNISYCTNLKYTIQESPEIEVWKNDTKSKPKGSSQEDFPWSHFASLAIHNLIN
ncbi:mediator of RNA polymerase II transcription subunit 15-like [Aphis craccivora]|uniref:Mediator of RNA polymerase II transcription subunit 15-like n=1 Tax=Aphis craccivora TaxID=307492 RepID=A0A6G0VWT9_APHCR|nr:mediator of RNA polymerase II transcription subunit 15-like [Aphis craccivora]